MGSASVFQRGLMGDPLCEGELLEIGAAAQRSIPEFEIPQDHLPNLSHQNLLRVIMGPRKNDLRRKESSISSKALTGLSPNQTGWPIRLEGPKINHRGKADIISEPLMPGAISKFRTTVAPIILMVDGQVTEEYAKIANVIRADISVLAQKNTG